MSRALKRASSWQPNLQGSLGLCKVAWLLSVHVCMFLCSLFLSLYPFVFIWTSILYICFGIFLVLAFSFYLYCRGTVFGSSSSICPSLAYLPDIFHPPAPLFFLSSGIWYLIGLLSSNDSFSILVYLKLSLALLLKKIRFLFDPWSSILKCDEPLEYCSLLFFNPLWKNTVHF